MSVLSRPYFHEETKAFEYVESIIWADGKACPHCGGLDRLTKVTANPAKRIRVGLWRCGHCKKQFTVKIGTVFEHMRIPLNKALQALYMMTTSKNGVTAHQLHRTLETTYKTAWFLAHRIREAMASGDLTAFGGGGGIVEVDETFIVRIKGAPKKRAFHHKMKVLALVDRGTGKARTMVVDEVTAKTIMPIVKANVAKEAILMTDESGVYRRAGKHYNAHGTTNHSQGQYVDYEIPEVHSTKVEGSNDELSNTGACNTASSPANINPTDEADAPLIYAAISAKCSDDGHLFSALVPMATHVLLVRADGKATQRQCSYHLSSDNLAR